MLIFSSHKMKYIWNLLKKQEGPSDAKSNSQIAKITYYEEQRAILR